ncbi:MAG: MBL fold metallo-hydrolase [Deltaproteobacteria bacterium]|nr:MBL fold metallo-hydrolase [Deltaproteobacteria bacterium]
MNDELKRRVENVEKKQAVQVIDFNNVKFENPHPDVHVAKIPIANASWINTSDGVVLVDTLLRTSVSAQMREKILETGGPIKKIIYTHHHVDHVGGARVFEKDKPEIIAHQYLPDDIEKFQILKEHRARIASIQFNIPFDPNRPASGGYLPPTQTYSDSMVFTHGDKTFELYHARAETDDATWVFVPEIKAAFVGDLIISNFPNIGNPFKPDRFALPWARALEKIRDKQPQLLVAHGGRAVYQGDEVKELLDATIEAIYAIHDQVVDAINKDVPIDEMIHDIALPDHLKDSPYLQFVYSRPEFAVYNIYRRYHGYFDHNPAHLLPRPEKEVNSEVFKLIGDPQAILNRATELFDTDQPQLALQVLDILLKQDPDHIEGRRLHYRILELLCETDYCLMSRNTWVYFMEQDKTLLKEKGVEL